MSGLSGGTAMARQLGRGATQTPQLMARRHVIYVARSHRMSAANGHVGRRDVPHPSPALGTNPRRLGAPALPSLLLLLLKVVV